MSATTVKGADELLAKIKQKQERIPFALAAALYLWAQQLGRVSKRLCPVDTGRLRSSFFVEMPHTSGTFIEVRFGYGTNYALAVHNRVYRKHAIGPLRPGEEAKRISHETGQDHFLSQPFDEAKGTAAEWIAEQTRQNLRRGVGSAIVEGGEG